MIFLLAIIERNGSFPRQYFNHSRFPDYTFKMLSSIFLDKNGTFWLCLFSMFINAPINIVIRLKCQWTCRNKYMFKIIFNERIMDLLQEYIVL